MLLLSTGGAGAAGLYAFVAEYDGGMPLKWTTGLDMVYQDSTVNGLFEIVGNTDPGGAAAYLERISSGSERDAALAGVVQQWITQEPDASTEWLANWTDRPRVNLPSRDPDLRDDRRGRGGSAGGESATGSSQPPAASPVIPEPSAALLAGVGAVALLRRRRSA